MLLCQGSMLFHIMKEAPVLFISLCDVSLASTWTSKKPLPKATASQDSATEALMHRE